MSEELPNELDSADTCKDISAQLDALLVNGDHDLADQADPPDDPTCPAGWVDPAHTANDSSTHLLGSSNPSGSSDLWEDSADIHKTPVNAPDTVVDSPKLGATDIGGTPADTETAEHCPTMPLTGKDQMEPLFNRVDQILAEQAEQAIANNFETVSNVTADEPQVPLVDDSQLDVTGPLQGSYYTPEQLLSGGRDPANTAGDRSGPGPSEPAYNTSLSAMREQNLDASGATASESVIPSADATNLFLWQRLSSHRTAIKGLMKRLSRFVLRQLHWTCAVMNLPLAPLSPSRRNIIGYAGLVTLFNAATVTISKLLLTL